MLRSLIKRMVTTVELTSDVPPWLSLPLAGKTCQFSLASSKTISDLVAEIKHEDSRILSIAVQDAAGKPLPPTTSCQELTNFEFRVLLDGREVAVLPGLSQYISGSEDHFAQCRSAGIPFNDARAICNFICRLQNQLTSPEDFKNFRQIAEESLITLMRNRTQERQVLETQLSSYEGELQKLKEAQALANRMAEAAAKRVCVSGLLVMMAQWSGIYYGTFFAYGWDVMEPITYMIGASWAVLGYTFFLRNKVEFKLNTFRHMLARNKRAKLYKKRGIDLERIALLERNILIVKRMIEETKS